MTRSLALLAAVVLGGCTPSTPAEPNVLFVVVDALRADHVSAYGYGRATTPALDALAERGWVFTDATSPSSYTRATVASLFTGALPFEHGVVSQGAQVETLGEEWETLAEVLQRNGYRTAAFMPNPSLSRNFNFDQGFDLYDDRFVRDARLRPERRFETATRMNRRALRFLDANPDAKFFLYLHYRDVHGPYVPPEPWSRMFGRDGMPRRELSAAEKRALPEYLALADHDGTLNQYVDRYDGEIRYTDDHIAELLDELGRRGVLEDTLVIVTSDHGESFLERGLWNHGTGLYEEEIRVPLVVVPAGGAAQARRIDTPVHTGDLLRTVLELVGLPAPRAAGGQSLVDVVEDGGLADRALVSHARIGDERFAALRVGSEKILWNVDSGELRLFDLSGDPGERRDLSLEDPGRVAALRSRLEPTLSPGRAADGKARPLHPDTVRGLKELGYLE